MERFDTDNKVWETVTSMKISRSALSVNVIDGKLYAMGGYDGNHVMENYFSKKNLTNFLFYSFYQMSKSTILSLIHGKMAYRSRPGGQVLLPLSFISHRVHKIMHKKA